MSLRSRLRSAARAFAGKNNVRGYRDIVGLNGQNGDWVLSSMSEDADLWQNIYALTSRCRDLFKTNPLYIKYRELLWANIFGSDGIMLRMKVQETENRTVHTTDEKCALFFHEQRINRIREWAKRQAGNDEFRILNDEERYRAFKLADALEDRSLDAVLRGTAMIEVGAPDVFANSIIEASQIEWQAAKFCDMRGTRNYFTSRCLRLIGAVRDGDFFIRMIRDPRVNKFGFTLQLITAEWCDRLLNAELPNGNVVRMGIEYQMTPWGLGPVVAYYFIKRTATDWQYNAGMWGGTPTREMHQRIEARDIIHYARPVEAEGTRPAPWVASTIPKGRQLDQYELAEVVAAREAACKTGFLWSDVMPEGGNFGQVIDPQTGNNTSPLSPGETRALPFGVKYTGNDPKHPNGNFETFRKGMVRSLTAGMPGADYNTLANDLENINFSAGRLGRLDTNEMSKLLQRFDIDTAERPIFEAWLEMALITGAIPLPLVKFKKFNKPLFSGRRWQQVDETKAVNAAALRVANLFSSDQRECAELGVDLEEILFEQAESNMLKEQLGLNPLKTVETPVIGTEEDTTADGGTDTTTTKPPSGNTKKPAAKSKQTAEGEEDMTATEVTDLVRTLLDEQDRRGFNRAPAAAAPAAPVIVNVPEIRVPPIDMSNVKFEFPEQKAPIVNVSAAEVHIPEQREMPAPIVNVSVNPTPVTIENTVEVPTASSVTINRDEDGKMTGADIARS